MRSSRQARGKQARSKESGFTLVEAMVATVIMGIAFAGIFSLTIASNYNMKESVARQKLQMQADQILEIIESDAINIDQYNNIDLTNCVAPGGGETEKYQLRPFEWCSRINGEVGVAVAAEERSIEVTTLADGRKVVHIILEAVNDNVQIVMKRSFEDPAI